MATSSAIGSYEDIREVADKAIGSERGIRIKFETRGRAIHFRQRFYTFRRLDRESSKRFYEKADPAYGVSVYDRLVANIHEDSDEIAVHIIPAAAGTFEVEEL